MPSASNGLAKAAAIWALAILMGCASRYSWSQEDSRPPIPIPRSLAEHFDISGEKHSYSVELAEEHGLYEIYHVAIREGERELANLVWYRPRNRAGARPVEFLWPILVGKKMPVASLLASQVFVPLGIDAVIMRQTKSLFSRREMRSPEEFEEFHEELVRQLLRAVQWARTRPEFDARKFGMTGTSYGGILTAMCIPFTPEFVSHKIIMGGGGIGEILLQTEERRVVDWREATLSRMEEDLRAEGGIEEAAIPAQARRRLLDKVASDWDPMTLSQYGDPREIAMVITMWDRHVPTANQIALWEGLGKPNALFVWTGHYTLFLGYFEVQAFLRETARKHYRMQ